MSENLDFRHEKLDHNKNSMRVVRILPAEPADNRVQCKISHITLDEEYDYTCLSYVWGSSEDRHEVVANGARLFVTTNLWEFLKVAQLKYPDRTF